MSGMVKQMLANSLLQDDNFALRALNAYIKAENASLKAEIIALKERQITKASSHPTLASNAPQLDEMLTSKNSVIPPDDQSPEALMPQASDMNEEESLYVIRELCDAAGGGNMEDLGRLLSTEKGRACIDGGTPIGLTPLHQAALMSKFDAVKLLVESGAEVDRVSNPFATPLTQAAKYGYESMAEYLLSNGASKEKAIESADEDNKVLVEGFFLELERVIQHRRVFQAMREELKDRVRRSEKPEALPTSCKGITIEGLKKMKALIQSECEAGRFKEDKSFPDGTHCKGTMLFDELTTTDIVYRFVKDESITDNLRLIDKPGIVAPVHKALPTFFISHAWKGRFSVLLDKIFEYVEKHGLSDETAVWIDVFSVNQHGSKDCSEFSQEQNQADVSAFKDVVQTCINGTLVVCDFAMCVTSTRAWCLYEWDWTMFYHGRENLHFLGISRKEAEDGRDTTDVDDAKCFKIADKEMILKEIIDKHGSTGIFNDKLKKKWMDVWNGIN